MPMLDLNDEERPGDNKSQPAEPEFIPVAYEPETPGENVRRWGLAWSAGIVFVGSVAFMLFIGWLADWVLGSSPWGLVAGIVIGSGIGFLQFFRITSQIFGSGPPPPEITHLPLDDD